MTAFCGSKKFAIKCKKCRSTQTQIIVDEWDSVMRSGVRLKIECTKCGAEETTYEHVEVPKTKECDKCGAEMFRADAYTFVCSECDHLTIDRALAARRLRELGREMEKLTKEWEPE